MGTRTPVFAVRGRRLNRLTMEAYLAAELGFEPRQHESESWVLPLHNSATSTGHDVPDQRMILYRFGSGLSIDIFSIHIIFTFELSVARAQACAFASQLNVGK